ncbi:unnamed protein product [Moneuplotes crassus]|uniref:Uncharacterized protein n=1 Tax=Euplotes crassus TaxID=5936 RepID=A0AAD2D8W4_EUPCR|nr:unnamed protein product [Moneuplotes crassus]
MSSQNSTDLLDTEECDISNSIYFCSSESWSSSVTPKASISSTYSTDSLMSYSLHSTQSFQRTAKTNNKNECLTTIRTTSWCILCLLSKTACSSCIFVVCSRTLMKTCSHSVSLCSRSTLKWSMPSLTRPRASNKSTKYSPTNASIAEQLSTWSQAVTCNWCCITQNLQRLLKISGKAPLKRVLYEPVLLLPTTPQHVYRLSGSSDSSLQPGITLALISSGANRKCSAGSSCARSSSRDHGEPTSFTFKGGTSHCKPNMCWRHLCSLSAQSLHLLLLRKQWTSYKIRIFESSRIRTNRRCTGGCGPYRICNRSFESRINICFRGSRCASL